MASALRMLAKRGTYDVFQQIRDRDLMHYNEVLNYALDARIIKSRASVTTILNDLTDYGLLERIVLQKRPTRIQYRVSEAGLKMLGHLAGMERIIIENAGRADPPDEG